MYAITAQKRAVKRPKRGSEAWEPDTAGFEKRWPNGKRPDLGTRTSESYADLADQVIRMNSAQIDANYLDWLFVVDTITPIHQCDENEKTA